MNKIRVTTISIPVPKNLSKKHPLTKKINMGHARRLLIRAGEMKSDIVLLPECFATKGVIQAFIGTKKSYSEIAEEVPNGEISRFVSAIAKKYGMYIIAPLYEKEKGRMYNSAILFDRKGKVAGIYRKVHLPPPGETSKFLPGTGFPVFKLDFGPVAICICYDLNYPEQTMTYALKGAKILFWATMWGNSIPYIVSFMKGQALANVLYLVSSNFCMPKKGGHPGQSAVIDPNGNVLANTGNRTGIASAVIDLNHERFIERKRLHGSRMPKLYKRLLLP